MTDRRIISQATAMYVGSRGSGGGPGAVWESGGAFFPGLEFFPYLVAAAGVSVSGMRFVISDVALYQVLHFSLGLGDPGLTFDGSPSSHRVTFAPIPVNGLSLIQPTLTGVGPVRPGGSWPSGGSLVVELQ